MHAGRYAGKLGGGWRWSVRALPWFHRWLAAATVIWLLVVTGLAATVARSQVAQLRALLLRHPERASSAVFALATVGLATALIAAAGLIAPAWRRRAVLALAVLPAPVLLVTSRNLLAGCAAVALLWPALWLGRELATWLLGPVDRASAWIVGAAVGLGLLAGLGYALGRGGALRGPVIWAILLLGALAPALVGPARRRLRADLAEFRCWLRQPGARRWEHRVLVGLLVGHFWLNLVGALAPEIIADAVVTRLPAAALFAREGRFVAAPELFVVDLPHVGEAIYAVVLASAPAQTAKIVDLLAGLLCAAAVWTLGRQLGGRHAAFVAALMFYTLPLTVWLSQTAYVDLFATLFAVTAVVAVVLHQPLTWRAGLLAATCIGLGLGVKSSFGLVAAGLLAALLVAALWRGRAATGAVAALALAALAVAALWGFGGARAALGLPLVRETLLRAWGGNPAVLAAFDGSGADRSLAALARSPLDLTLHTSRYTGFQDGAAGYLLLALVPLVLVTRPSRRGAITLIGAATAYLAWFATTQLLRYALPIFALCCALGAAAYVARGGRGHGWLSTLALGILLPALVGLGLLAYLDTILRYPGELPYRVVLGCQSKDSYLREHVGGFTALRLLDAEPGATRAVVPNEVARLYTRVRIDRSINLQYIGYHVPADEQVLLQHLDQRGFSHILVERDRLPPEWEELTIINEEFLRRNAVLIGGDRNAYLYRIVPPAERGRDQGWARGRELLANGGFENARNGLPQGWTMSGRPAYDTGGKDGWNSRSAIRVGPRDSFSSRTAVVPNRQYLLSHATRGADGYGLARLQINWGDAAGRTVGVSIEVVPASPRGYRLNSMLATAPPGAVLAVVFAQAQQGQVWYDDVSLRSVEDNSGTARGSGRPPVPVADRAADRRGVPAGRLPVRTHLQRPITASSRRPGPAAPPGGRHRRP